jgi:hypothetical protein
MSELSTSEFDLNNYSDEEKEIHHMIDVEAELNERYHTTVNNRYKTDKTYTQLMQIVLPTVDVNDESPIICIDKSTAKKEFYIYLPPYGNDYIFPINADLKVSDLLNYICNIEEFKKYYPIMQFEFILTLTMNCHPEEYDSESFLQLTLDKIPTSQAILIEQS